MVAEDPLKVLFRFKHKGNRELPLILGQLPVLPKHWYANRDFNRGNLEIPLGSGPYKVAEVKRRALGALRAGQGLLGQGPADQSRVL